VGGGKSSRSLLNDDIDISAEMNGSHKLVRADSVGGPGQGLIPLEICFHVKEAWNIFEVRICSYLA